MTTTTQTHIPIDELRMAIDLTPSAFSVVTKEIPRVKGSLQAKQAGYGWDQVPDQLEIAAVDGLIKAGKLPIRKEPAGPVTGRNLPSPRAIFQKYGLTVPEGN